MDKQASRTPCRDISTSALLFFYLQSWQAAFVILITIGSVSFFTYVGHNGLGAALNWTQISFVVLLPSLLLLYMVRLMTQRAKTCCWMSMTVILSSWKRLYVL